MSYDQIYAIATQGMNLEKLRVDIVANNIANEHTLQNTDGTMFQPMQVVATFSDFLAEPKAAGIESFEIVPEHLSPNKVYQPGHPSADRQGYITYPGISHVDEMTTLLRASRAFEANVKIMNTAHNLYLQALSIGEDK